MSYYLCGSLCRKYRGLSKPWNPFLKEVAMTSATMKVKLVNLLHLIVAWLLGSAFFAILLFPNKVFAQEVQLEVHTFSSTITLVVDEAEVPSWEALSTKMLEYCADRVDLGDVQEFFDCSSVPHALTYGSH